MAAEPLHLYGVGAGCVLDPKKIVDALFASGWLDWSPRGICIHDWETWQAQNVKGFGCTIFRKNYKQIFAQGGLWDEAQKMYHGINGAQRKISDGTWSFRDKNGNEVSKVSFAHIERSEELDNWQGAQICEIGFDELTHFSEEIFFYMLSRNRSTCGVKPFVRATCNPDADSWVAKFIAWWIDQDTGYPIPERSGLIRYMIRRDEVVYWADTREELWERFNLTTPEEKNEPKSVTFIMTAVIEFGKLKIAEYKEGLAQSLEAEESEEPEKPTPTDAELTFALVSAAPEDREEIYQQFEAIGISREAADTMAAEFHRGESVEGQT